MSRVQSKLFLLFSSICSKWGARWPTWSTTISDPFRYTCGMGSMKVLVVFFSTVALGPIHSQASTASRICALLLGKSEAGKWGQYRYRSFLRSISEIRDGKLYVRSGANRVSLKERLSPSNYQAVLDDRLLLTHWKVLELLPNLRWNWTMADSFSPRPQILVGKGATPFGNIEVSVNHRIPVGGPLGMAWPVAYQDYGSILAIKIQTNSTLEAETLWESLYLAPRHGHYVFILGPAPEGTDILVNLYTFEVQSDRVRDLENFLEVSESNLEYIKNLISEGLNTQSN